MSDGPGSLPPPLRLAGMGLLESRARYEAALNAARQIQVVALVEQDARLARPLARELGRSFVFSDLAALRESDVRPEALLLAVDGEARAAAIRSAIETGVPVLCDAPFAATLAEFDLLVHAADASGVILVPAFARPFDAWVALATERLAEDAIGDLRHVRCEWSIPTGGLSAVENGAPAEARSWIGHLPQFACQTADLCRRWLGEAQTISADIDLPAGGHGLPAMTGAGGTLANLIVSHARGQSTHHLSRSRGVHPLERYLFTGTNGEMELVLSAGETGPGAQPILRIQRTGQKPETAAPASPSALPPGVARQVEMLRAFAGAARGVPSPVTAADGRAALEIVHAGYASSLDRVKITLPLRRSPLIG